MDILIREACLQILLSRRPLVPISFLFSNASTFNLYTKGGGRPRVQGLSRSQKRPITAGSSIPHNRGQGARDTRPLRCLTSPPPQSPRDRFPITPLFIASSNKTNRCSCTLCCERPRDGEGLWGSGVAQEATLTCPSPRRLPEPGPPGAGPPVPPTTAELLS
ncbi:hypothetical protein AAFF_G00011910 [Aldrovandia affinis]|uniref:Uncharacterized protein n=1 Tax=Aldrovandia affinis TaxID=143900 RepID=A0AAD7WHD3_9TELE|nr:hypothetical protein AAFF_G00011910 [Aldrovandia affinis]